MHWYQEFTFTATSSTTTKTAMTKAQHSNLDHLESGVLLPCGYLPSPFTVIIGHGKEPKLNPGNQRLRILAQSFLQKYQYGDKKCKTTIVSDIIRMIEDVNGSFVKHSKNGRWYKQGNKIAREKVGYVFRDLLADQYKSSSKSKVARRQSEERHGNLASSMQSSSALFWGATTMIMDEPKSQQHPIEEVSDIMMWSRTFVGKGFEASNTSPAFANAAFSLNDVAYSQYHTSKTEFPSKRPSIISVEEIVDMMKQSGVYYPEEEEQETEELPAFIEKFSASFLNDGKIESLESDPFFVDNFASDPVDCDALLRMPLLTDYVTPSNRLR